MRGNPQHLATVNDVARSIPAHAGQPSSCGDARILPSVYPRACGATRAFVIAVHARAGLSPRMRGNPALSAIGSLPCRSIPAHAGQPRVIRYWKPPLQVYPRACGATSFLGFPYYPCSVYPRACGATLSALRFIYSLRGLSPRMRGNR